MTDRAPPTSIWLLDTLCDVGAASPKVLMKKASNEGRRLTKMQLYQAIHRAKRKGLIRKRGRWLLAASQQEE